MPSKRLNLNLNLLLSSVAILAQARRAVLVCASPPAPAWRGVACAAWLVAAALFGECPLAAAAPVGVADIAARRSEERRCGPPRSVLPGLQQHVRWGCNSSFDGWRCPTVSSQVRLPIIGMYDRMHL